MERVFGIDVSLWQKGFDFTKAAAEGVKFAILKCSQEDFKDPQFENHYAAAKAAGIPVGAYHYTKATSAAAARAEAKTCINAIKGKVFEYPIFLDIEDGVNKKLTKAQNDEIIKAFCTELEAAGYWTGFYCNYDFYKNYCSGKTLSERFSLWLASWGASAPAECQIWQFGGETNVIRTNKVAGIVCDQSYAYKDFPAQIKAKGLNGFKKQEGKIIYQSYFKGKWGHEIEQGSGSYSGLIGNAISGFRAKFKDGRVVHSQSHMLGGGWLLDCTKYVKDGGPGTGYSGYIGKPTDAIRLWADKPFEYRAHVKGGEWCSWIKSSNHDKVGYYSYAGIIGKELDGIQIR